MSVLDDFAPDPNAESVLDNSDEGKSSVLDEFAPAGDTSVLDAPSSEQVSVLDAFSPDNYDPLQAAEPASVNPDVKDELDQQASDAGVLDRVKSATFSVLAPISDILSRTNYATAGFTEALMDDDPRTNPFARAGREMFAGIGGLKGDKHEWGQALEQMGVDEGWKMSELMPFMFNDTGKGILQFEKGGIMDWTGRGAAGLGANILTDPLTYLDWAGKGIQVSLRGAGPKAGKVIGKKFITKAGGEELVTNVAKGLGLTGDGIEVFRRDLYSALPNLDGKFRLSIADDHVKQAFLNSAKTEAIAKGLGYVDDIAKLPDIPLSAMSKDQLFEVSRAAQEVAEQRLSNVFFTDPAAARKLFADGGVRFMGRVIPGTPRAAELMSHLSVDARVKATQMFERGADKSVFVRWMLEASREASGRLAGVGRLFKRDLSTNPIYNIGKQKILDEMAQLRGEFGSQLHRGMGDIHMSPVEWETLIKAIDSERRALGMDWASKFVPNNHLFKADQALDAPMFSAATGQSIGTAGEIQQKFFDAVANRVKGKVGSEESVRRATKETMSLLDKMDELESWVMENGLTDSAKIEGQHIVPVLQMAGRSLASMTPARRAEALRNPMLFAEDTVRAYSKQARAGWSEAQSSAVAKFLYQRTVQDYGSNIPIYFNNRASKITQALSLVNESRNVRFNEDLFHGGKQGFYSAMDRSEFEEASKQMQRADSRAIRLNPIYDLREVGRARIDQYVQAREAERFAHLIRTSFGIDVNKGEGAVARNVFRDLNDGDVGAGLTTTRRQQLDKEHSAWMNSADRGELDRSWPRAKREVRAAAETNTLPPGVRTLVNGLSRDEKRYWIAKEYLNSATDRDLRAIMLRYQEQIAEDPSILPKFRNQGMRKQFETTNFRELSIKGPVATETVWVPVDIFDDFTSMQKQLMDSRDVVGVLKAIDGLNGFFKTWVTAPFPAFHLRNLYGNLSLGFTDVALGALDPRDHFLASAIVADIAVQGRKVTRQAMNSIVKPVVAGAIPGAVIGGIAGASDFREEGWAGVAKGAATGAALGGSAGLALAMARRAYFKDEKRAAAFQKIMDTRVQSKTGRTYTIQQIANEGRRLGVWTDDIKLFELAGEYNPYATGRLTELKRRVEQELRAPGEVIENEMRMMLFIKHLRRGLSPEDAAARVKKFLFDYSNTSPAEKAFFRRVIPFWTFFRRNVPLQVQTLLTDPGKIAIQSKLLQERINEKDRLAMYDVNGTWVRLNRKGDELKVLTGIDLPFTQLNYLDVLAGSGPRTRELAAMISPLWRAPFEGLTGGDVYTGRQFGRKEHASVGAAIDKFGMPQGVKDWLGYTKEFDDVGRPVYKFDQSRTYFLFDAWALSRIVRTSDKVWNSIVDGADPNLLQKFLTATETKNLDLNAEDDLRLKRRTQMVRDALKKRGLPVGADTKKVVGY